MLLEKENALQPFTVEEITTTNNTNFTGGAIQTKNRYVTAMQVIKPRNLNKVISKCVEEASIAGEEFLYSWKQGGSIIEGLTIGAALCIVRNFGNSFVDVEVEEQDKAYIFTAYFCDLETGFNLSRSYRQNKQSPKTKFGKDVYEGDRGTDIIFQIGQSKAIRNVVLNAVPRWLATKVLEEAKNNAMATINNMGEAKARELLLKKINNLKVPLEKVENLFGKVKSWDKIKLVQLSSALRALENGYEDEGTLFPSVTGTKEILTQAEKEALLSEDEELTEELSVSTTNRRTQMMRVSQEILAAAEGDYKTGAELLSRLFKRKFKLNTSFTAQLSQEEMQQIDGKFADLLEAMDSFEVQVA
jgi:hypothetical protein